MAGKRVEGLWIKGETVTLSLPGNTERGLSPE